MSASAERVAIGSFVDVAAGRIHVREDGPANAPAIVLVHGFAASLHWFDLLTPLVTEVVRQSSGFVVAAASNRCSVVRGALDLVGGRRSGLSN